MKGQPTDVDNKDMPSNSERRQKGLMVDVRIVLSDQPDGKLMLELQRALRRSDSIFSFEGNEVQVALGGTTAENAVRYVVPKLQLAATRCRVKCSFLVNGRPVAT